MRRREHRVWSRELGESGRVFAYGHGGLPVLVFPTSRGTAADYESYGMVDAVGDLVGSGRVTLYCVDSADADSWFDRGKPLEERARVHQRYESWILDDVLPVIARDSGAAAPLATTGCSFGAYHAANIALRHPERFPLALCLSGFYDVAELGWGERGDGVYFHNPMDHVAGLGNGHLDWLRTRVELLLVCGQGAWEDTTGCLGSTKAFAARCHEKGLNAELDLWGADVPHDWSSWRTQIAHHLPRYC